MWDFYCEKCNTTTEKLVKNFVEAENQVCNTCGTPLTRNPPSGGFVVKGYNYKNGYSKNR